MLESCHTYNSGSGVVGKPCGDGKRVANAGTESWKPLVLDLCPSVMVVCFISARATHHWESQLCQRACVSSDGLASHTLVTHSLGLPTCLRGQRRTADDDDISYTTVATSTSCGVGCARSRAQLPHTNNRNRYKPNIRQCATIALANKAHHHMADMLGWLV